MLYYFNLIDDPPKTKNMWKLLQQMWDMIHIDLMGVYFKIKEDALNKRFRKSLDPRPLAKG